MGIQTLNTPAANVTSTVPVAKDVQVKVFQVTRTDTVSSVKLVLPADATILYVVKAAATASNAGTTATVAVTFANNSGTITNFSDDVKGSSGTAVYTGSGAPNAQPMPLTGDITVSAVYAETGAASSAGGPWTYIVTYVR